MDNSFFCEALFSGPKSHLLSKIKGKHLLVLSDDTDLFFNLGYFTKKEVILFPAWETLPNEGVDPSPDVVGERFQALKKIEDAKEPLVILTSLQALLQKVIPKTTFDALYFEMMAGKEYPFQEIVVKLKEMGYVQVPLCADKGEFSVRGGIIDVYPVASPDPFRIEFLDDEVESIRVFDPIGQRSIRNVKEIQITPGVELSLLEGADELQTLLDYLGEKCAIVFDDPVAIEDRWVQLKSVLGRPTKTFSSIDEWMKEVKGLQKIFFFKEPLHKVTEVQWKKDKATFELFGDKFSIDYLRHRYQSLDDHLALDTSALEPKELLEELFREDLQFEMIYSTDTEKEVLCSLVGDKKVDLAPGNLTEGFVDTEEHKVYFPFTEISHKKKIVRQKQRSTYHTTAFHYEELHPGDVVVHLNNGIGRYLGMEKRKNVHGIETEFLTIEYAEGGKLFVPLDQSYLVTRYIGAHDETPRLHTIGSSKWQKTKEKTQTQIMGYAKELLELYAERELKGGLALSQDSYEVASFEEDFPYLETEDQLQAIASLKGDMEREKPMDRLVCGDVGYGKTEVAMRAAFKMVMDGAKQVAVLVPTTILAMQHYENFQERMSNFPVRVAHLSRFLKTKDRRVVIEGIERGSIDIVIGTHRLISQDIIFKDLGLVIIDEEQRFGVKAKEHLKQAKTGVDCLTLSATPIPRTLYMSMIGVRDVSTINTPPQDRLPIKSIIAEPSDQLVHTALMRELNRDGQIYIIHNRVETIFEFANKIQKLVPHAKVIVGHGQMSSDEIDRVFHAFKQGNADILIATTIVENGIDIPNANTILIDQADKFGMADLYQLRGRVGRWNRRAFCYFLVKSIKRMPDIAKKRLQALAESSGYGGGMKVAMRDLEIRGAGDILGVEQSGHVSSIGFQLYCKLLQKTIKALKGDLPKNLTDCRVEIPMDARLPERYVNDVALRMEIYRRFGESYSLDEVDEIYQELHDRYGPPPPEAVWLYHLARLRVHGSYQKCTLIKLDKVTLLIERKKGANKEQKKILFGSYSNPQNFEEKVVKAIKA